MRVAIFHGYLLSGTGSNVYNAQLARALVGLGHEVHLLCQDRRALDYDFVDAIGDWEGGRLRVRTLREPARCTVYTPDIGEILPVYVLDQYEGFRAIRFLELADQDLDSYLERNVSALREVVARSQAQAAVANHLVMGPAICARALPDGVPYAVKVHGSALEYTVRRDIGRFLPVAREGILGARSVLVGSSHIARRLFELLQDPAVEAKTRLSPPGVDTDSFRMRSRDEARAGLRQVASGLEQATLAWGGHADAAAAIRKLDSPSQALVLYVGKLLSGKGVDLLLCAWPLVCAEVSNAQLGLVGFGTFRPVLERMLGALRRADLDELTSLCVSGRSLAGEGCGRLAYLESFLESLDGPTRRAYLQAAPRAAELIQFTGRLEHHQLVYLLGACEAQVVPSTFGEAFGMVAAEGAACGALPLAAAHTGLSEVTRQLEPAVEPEVADLLSFELGPTAVWQIADKLVHWLTLAPARRERARCALAGQARDLFGWDKVATRVVRACRGELDELPSP